MPKSARFAVVSPYYTESRKLISRCIDSVKRQTVLTDHLLIADGFPEDWIDHQIDFVAVLEWLASVPEERRKIVARLCGGDLVQWAQRTLAEIKSQKK